MIQEYDIRDRVKAMSEAERNALPHIVNNNGRDYASCPCCKHYHAMMPDSVDGFHFVWCRDCRHNDIVVLAVLAKADEGIRPIA